MYLVSVSDWGFYVLLGLPWTLLSAVRLQGQAEWSSIDMQLLHQALILELLMIFLYAHVSFTTSTHHDFKVHLKMKFIS